MHENENPTTAAPKRVPWNKGKLIGPRPPLKQKHVWAIRTRLQLERQVRDLALFNLAIDSKLRGCDLVAIRVDDVAPNGYAIERASVRQRKTGRPVRFELTEQTRLAIDEYLTRGGKKAANFAVTHNAALGRLWPDGAICMRRRDFIGLLGGVAVGWPLAARAQRSGSVWRIGFITHTANDAAYASLFERLRELGYLEGQNIIVERRYAEGRAERFQEFAAEMVRLKADVVITSTTPAALALRNATTTIPIVIPTAIDPIGTGLIASLAHPGGNITGGALLSAELGAKRIELLKEVVPGLSRMAVLWNGANPANALAWRETEGAAHALGVTLQSYDVKGPKDFNIAFATMAQHRPDAVSVLTDALITQYQREIVDFAINDRLPSVFPSKDPIKLGGLLSYGPHYSEMMRRAASQVDKILRGAQPADLPMEQPTTFELVINLNTARAVGVVLPPLMLSRADEVIE